jgi:Siphovirus Gp157
MSAAPIAITADEVAKGLNMFEIDESLEALFEAAEQEAEANNGEISENIKTALATYAEAFGFKVDRIANYLKAQKAEAELARREGDRFQARYKAAENREKRLKQMLVWFMTSRNATKLRVVFLLHFQLQVFQNRFQCAGLDFLLRVTKEGYADAQNDPFVLGAMLERASLSFQPPLQFAGRHSSRVLTSDYLRNLAMSRAPADWGRFGNVDHESAGILPCL